MFGIDDILIELAYLRQFIFGGLAQLGEHLPYKQRVTGSSPVSSICGCGGIGRRARFRILYLLDVRVQVPSSAFEIILYFKIILTSVCDTWYINYCCRTVMRK